MGTLQYVRSRVTGQNRLEAHEAVVHILPDAHGRPLVGVAPSEPAGVRQIWRRVRRAHEGSTLKRMPVYVNIVSLGATNRRMQGSEVCACCADSGGGRDGAVGQVD